MPGLGGLIGAQQFERAALVRRELMALTWLFATAVGATILLWNRSFVTLWVGGERACTGRTAVTGCHHSAATRPPAGRDVR